MSSRCSLRPWHETAITFSVQTQRTATSSKVVLKKMFWVFCALCTSVHKQLTFASATNSQQFSQRSQTRLPTSTQHTHAEYLSAMHELTCLFQYLVNAQVWQSRKPGCPWQGEGSLGLQTVLGFGRDKTSPAL